MHRRVERSQRKEVGPGMRRPWASASLAVAAGAALFPLYAVVRWFAIAPRHATQRQAVAAFEGGFPAAIRGSGITWLSLACGGVTLVVAGLVWQRTSTRIRTVSLVLMILGACLVMMNLWSLM